MQTKRDCSGWDPYSDGGWDQCDPKTIPAARRRRIRADIRNYRQQLADDRQYALQNPLSSLTRAGLISAAGATLGSLAVYTPCATSPSNFLCGPVGAYIGADAGFFLTGAIAGVTALVTKNETAKDTAIASLVSWLGMNIAWRLFANAASTPVASTPVG